MSLPPSKIPPIKVTVNSIGRIQELIGEKMVEIILEEGTVRDLLRTLSRLYGEKVKKAILKDETEELYVLILVNGRDIHFIQKLDTLLKEGDRIDIIPLIAGG